MKKAFVSIVLAGSLIAACHTAPQPVAPAIPDSTPAGLQPSDTGTVKSMDSTTNTRRNAKPKDTLHR